MTSRTAWLLIMALAIGPIAAGCGSRRPPRYRVTGRMVFAGRPVAAGEVSFAPDRGHTGPGAFAGIVAGRYETSLGVAGGPTIVTVTGYDGPPGGEDSPEAGRLLFDGWQMPVDLPRSDTTLDIEVPAVAGRRK
jgi:hypothetical protein